MSHGTSEGGRLHLLHGTPKKNCVEKKTVINFSSLPFAVRLHRYFHVTSTPPHAESLEAAALARRQWPHRPLSAFFQALNCLLRTLETAAKLKSEAAKSEKTLKAQKHRPSKTTQ